MKIAKSVNVNAPTDEVWDILGPNYLRVGDWASSVHLSDAKPGPITIEGAPAAGRTCETSLGPFTETIEEYDAEAHRIAYSATGAKMPGFVRSLVARWKLTPTGPSSTRVEMAMDADIAQPFRTLMGWMMERQFGSVIDTTLDDLRIYAETGLPSERT